MNISVKKILPNPEQPRKEFDKAALQELADSIREHGVILPISVEESTRGMYILHDGERRLRAARLLGMEEIPAVVLPAQNGHGQEQRLMRALVANLQRADLNPIEEGEAFQRMVKDLGMSMIEVAQKLGVKYSRVIQRIELLELDRPIQQMIADGQLTRDHRVVKKLMEVPGEHRVKLAKSLAERGVSIKSAVEACDRLIGALAAEKIKGDQIPSVTLATKTAGPVSRPLWDVFAQAGQVPPYLLVEISARNVCDRCGLRDVASAQTCRGCALVEVLIEMIGRTKTRGVTE